MPVLRVKNNGVWEEVMGGDIPLVPTSLKNPYALTVNGTTYDGSMPIDITSDVNALIEAMLGVIENGSY